MTRPGNGESSLVNRLLARAIGNPYPPPGILRQHVARVLAELAAFTDDYPDPGYDSHQAPERTPA